MESSNPNNPTASSLTKRVREIFYYNEEYRIVICLQHHCVVVDRQVNRHLSSYHQEDGLCSTDARRVISQYFEQNEKRIQSLKELNLPTGLVPPIHGLKIHEKTFQCHLAGCGWIGKETHRIQEHYQREHGWTNRNQLKSPWRVVASQQFTTRGPQSQLFAVQYPHGAGPMEETIATASPPALINDLPYHTTLGDENDFESVPPDNVPGGEQDTAAPDYVIIHRTILASPVALRLMGALVDWQQHCPICRFCDDPPSQQSHSLADCPRKDDVRAVRNEWCNIQANIECPSPSTCPDCFLPKMVCRRYPVEGGAPEPDTETPCQFPGVILLAVVSAMLINQGWYETNVLPQLQRDGIDHTQAYDFYRWLGKEIEWHGIRYNKIGYLFYQIAINP
jgi:hypothetical protein